MSRESAISQAFKDSFITALKAFYVKPTYRCMFLDDEPGLEEEERDFPCVEINVSPTIPRGYRSMFNDTQAVITWTTTFADDPKKKILCDMYTLCREQIENFDYSIMAVFIEDSDTSDADNRQEITLTLRCSSCGG